MIEAECMIDLIAESYPRVAGLGYPRVAGLGYPRVTSITALPQVWLGTNDVVKNLNWSKGG